MPLSALRKMHLLKQTKQGNPEVIDQTKVTVIKNQTDN
jgi:hypothetical protein